ncbi:MAG TPA: hypothetical protein ENO22_13230 [candidate division Zixibacteria bacterium]|jgi:Fe-S cluster assembly iron-binding protein IscA|nr:hypothetical protein [candidate division Zixibacteria bacterium]HER00296.1 hypothetical protein [candidate division Zixibacteria bacterium]
MALDESTDGLTKLESNGINVYIDPRLKEHLGKFGDINVDFVTNPMGQSGYMIKIGSEDCSEGGCSGCG